MSRRIDLTPLRIPAYRRFFAGWTLYLASAWVYSTALTWTFLQSSGTAAAVGYLPVALVLPVPVALVLGGLITDRRGPKAALVFSQSAMCLTVLAIGLLSAAGQLTFVPVLVTGFLIGIFGGFGGVPAQALMVRLVDRRLMASVYALSLVSVGLGRLVGGPLGGQIVQLVGATPALMVGAAGIGASALLFATLPHVEPLETAAARVGFRDLGDTIRWVRWMPAAIAIIALEATLSGLVYPYQQVMPVIARDVLGGGAPALGLLVAAGGAGVVLGGTFLAFAGRRLGQGRLLAAAIITAASGIAGLAISHSLLLSMVLAALVAGGSNAASMTASLLLQTMSPPRMRGRVLALDSVVSSLANPISLLGVGLLVERLGPTPVLLAMAGLGILALAAVRLAHRPILTLDVDSRGHLVPTMLGSAEPQPGETT